jgi:hypothetical protein
MISILRECLADSIAGIISIVSEISTDGIASV